MKTDLKNLFNEDAYLKKNETIIHGRPIIEDKHYLVLVDTIFYPQGGGQKGDRGTITFKDQTVKVINTIKHPELRGVLVQIDQELIDTPLYENVDDKLAAKPYLICKLDWPFRYAQMRLHTTLHLYHCLLEKVLGKPVEYPKISSIKDDNTAFLQYENSDINEEICQKAFELLLEEIAGGCEVITYPDQEKDGYRWWKYKEWTIPCGGTHVKNTKEIGAIEYTYRAKKGHQTIDFILKEVK